MAAAHKIQPTGVVVAAEAHAHLYNEMEHSVLTYTVAVRALHSVIGIVDVQLEDVEHRLLQRTQLVIAVVTTDALVICQAQIFLLTFQ